MNEGALPQNDYLVQNSHTATAGILVTENAITSYSNEPRSIIIEPLNYGFNVRVGCQSFAFESKERVISAITKYLENPSDASNEWMNNKKLPI